MVGDTLYPLNRLKEIHPETFDDHAKKYVGREKLMERRLPILDCLWNDVLHLSPINPQIILDVWEKHGLKKDLEFPTFKIPVTALDPENLITYHPHLEEGKRSEPFSLEHYKELSAVTEQQINVWLDDHKVGRPMFWFSHTTHVLYKGEIDTTGFEVITCK